MEEKPFKALAKSLGHRGSGKSSPHDIRNLCTTATQSQPKLNVPLPTVREDSELEGSSVGSKTCWSYNQKAGHDSDGGWEESGDGEDKGSFKPEELDEHALMELEMRRGSSLGGPLEEDDSKTDDEKSSSVSSLNISKHTPHRAYWVEQQSRLPLPLTELMENEALEILTKALRSEPPHSPSPQLPHETLGDLPGLRPVGVGFQDVSALSDPLTTHKYSRSPKKSKKLGDWAQGDPMGTAWGDRQGPGL
ncbi:cation channel sperm-associated auxiliary subunit zeta isoform X1 [Globicephala melas]|uniref:cation channel sperm-associated auxiliary subunit zeta isoform X1 n=1 Tax=Globicephala melas TaxID=9731 RepID=UPI00293D4D7E|nr:cation channel sperm-associated auxiliary subunit zeta isoform X1 [Globicephala melas]